MRLKCAGVGQSSLHAAGRAGVGVVQLVEAVPAVAVATLDEGVGEHLLMTGRLPHLAGLEDRRVEADDVVALLDHGPPPRFLDVAQQLDTQRPVVVRGAEPAVDLGGLKDEATLLGEVGDGVEGDFGHE